ncbi:Fringe-like [Popillia japonica]|uniref:Fringe-like n=1 Tax=Popillia japonica TaxID=7064 RepID=A0AAW1I745_POPJA
MNSRTRRFLQTLTVVVLIAYTTLLAYQSLSRAVYNAEGDGNAAKLSNYLDEGRDTYDGGEATSEIPSVTATMRPPTTTLDDAGDGNAAKLSNYLDEGRDTYDGGEATSEIPSVTATMRPPTTTLDDVFISVKTTKLYHRQRLPIILKTWFQLAKAQTWFFTDIDDPEFQKQTKGKKGLENETRNEEKEEFPHPFQRLSFKPFHLIYKIR